MKHLKIYASIRLIRRHGSIRKAAEQLAISPSALNRAVQGFENALGAVIFERIPSGVRLTSAGELLVDVVERHLIEFEDLQQRIGSLRDGQSGRLRVGMTEDIAAGLPLLVVRDVERDMPGVSIELIGGDPTTLLRRRDIDLAVVTRPETDRSVEVLASQNVPLVAYATADWPFEEAEVRGVWDLARGRMVLPPEGTGARAVISHTFRRHMLDEGVATSVAASHVHQAMSSGRRICIFPQSVFIDPVHEVPLHMLPIPIGTVQICVLRLSNVPLSRAGQALLRHLERRLNGFVQPMR